MLIILCYFFLLYAYYFMGDYMFDVGDLVTRKSYNNDIVFKIIGIDGDNYLLKGLFVRLYADGLKDDLKIYNDITVDDFSPEIDGYRNLERNEFFYLPARILHIDQDADFLDKCMKFYKQNKLKAFGVLSNDDNLSDDVIKDVKEAKKDHIDFTDEEIKKLWDHLYDTDYVDVILIQCYSGWRPQELGLIELKNVDLENWFFIGGMKTDAGKDRLVPIHPRIRDLVKHRYQEAINLGSDYLINCTDTKTHRSSLKMTYDKYRHRFEKIVKKLELNPDHRAHDPRIQFSTMAKRDKVDEYALKYMMGHKINDITEATYTKRKPEWLMAEIMKIK